jgi:hypothetical protein
MTLELPTPVQFSELEAIVQDRLNGRVRHLRLLAREDGLILAGIAQTYYAKQLGQHAPMEVSDLPICANEIEVV